jgi:hypothetical protein
MIIVIQIYTSNFAGDWYSFSLWEVMTLESIRADQSKQNFNLFLKKLFAELAELKRLESWSFSTVSMHGGSSLSPSHVA